MLILATIIGVSLALGFADKIFCHNIFKGYPAKWFSFCNTGGNVSYDPPPSTTTPSASGVSDTVIGSVTVSAAIAIVTAEAQLSEASRFISTASEQTIAEGSSATAAEPESANSATTRPAPVQFGGELLQAEKPKSDAGSTGPTGSSGDVLGGSASTGIIHGEEGENTLAALDDRNSAYQQGGGAGTAGRAKKGFELPFGIGKIMGSDSAPGMLSFDGGGQNRAVANRDPNGGDAGSSGSGEEYFGLIKVSDDLFKIVGRRYTQKATHWARQDSNRIRDEIEKLKK